jgi:hypothetical protein
MRSLLELAQELGLEPGQSHTESAGDRIVKLTVETVGADEEPSQFADMVMLDGIINYPPSPTAFTVMARFNENPPPLEPFHIDEWDRAPE